jgi:quinoprotein glucose dehydrogenase
LYAKVLAGDSVIEQQEVLAALGEMKEPQADAVLVDWLDKLAAGQVRPEIQLDLLTAAALRSASQVKDKLAAFEASRSKADSLAAYRETLSGGSVDRGQKIFFERAEASCVRCHKIGGTGGDVGPDLSKIGADKQREYLLESIVEPNKAIAKGFDSVVLVLDDGKVVSGVLRSEDEKHLKLVTPEGKQITVAKSQIDERTSGKSPMPEDVAKKLGKADIRDLVEFLSDQKAP